MKTSRGPCAPARHSRNHAASASTRKDHPVPMPPHGVTQVKLITAQLFSGAGIASGYAVGGLLAEQITGRTAMAGFAQMSVPIASRQDAREVCFVASSDDARVATAVTAGTRAGPALAMVRVSSSAVNAWICRWIAAGFRRT